MGTPHLSEATKPLLQPDLCSQELETRARPHLRAAELQQVDGLPADIHVVRDVLQERGHAVLHLLGDEHVAVRPVRLVCRWDRTRGWPAPADCPGPPDGTEAHTAHSQPPLPLKPRYSWFTWIMNSPYTSLKTPLYTQSWMNLPDGRAGGEAGRRGGHGGRCSAQGAHQPCLPLHSRCLTKQMLPYLPRPQQPRPARAPGPTGCRARSWS